MKESKNIAAIFAHPDDEVLACGGTIARHTEKGDVVRVLLLSSGINSRDSGCSEDIMELKEHAKNANEILGVEHIEFGDFPDNAMDSLTLLTVVKRIESFLEKYPSETIYTHHAGDLNIDHKIVNQAVLTACRPTPGSVVKNILSCEVNSSTEWADQNINVFSPTEYVNITNTLHLKIKALLCYKNEIRDWPHPRSEKGIEVLANYRGGQVGLEAAESFFTIRKIHKSI